MMRYDNPLSLVATKTASASPSPYYSLSDDELVENEPSDDLALQYTIMEDPLDHGATIIPFPTATARALATRTPSSATVTSRPSATPLATSYMTASPEQGPVAASDTDARRAAHSSPEDCWISYGGELYDVTSILASGPQSNGADLASYCGRDATGAFNTDDTNPDALHSSDVSFMLSALRVE
jgi:hypothetical protein